MSQEFRGYLQKVGSGTHTSKALTREESAQATRLMLRQTATPAQIGAYLIAHRIKRPTAAEMAGILDAFDELGPQISEPDLDEAVIVFSTPYDGRSRTAPVLPITALLLATVNYPVLMHGGDWMPTKYGIPLVELWLGLGVNWRGVALDKVQESLQQCKLGMVYLPEHFALAQGLVPYREQIGKRPPLATAELFWSPYAGPQHVISGYVHPPTAVLLKQVFELRGKPQRYTTVKGLEGSCDLPCDRTAIIGTPTPASTPDLNYHFLHPYDHDLGGSNLAYHGPDDLFAQMQQVLEGQDSPLLPAVLWNGGFYLWHLGYSPSLGAGIEQTRILLQTGATLATLQTLRAMLNPT